MPEFHVRVTRDVTESVSVTVTADDPAAAKIAAQEYIWNTSDVVEWELDDPPSHSDTYVAACDPV